MSDPYNTADSQPVTPREATPQPTAVRQSVMFRLLRYASVGIFTANMLVMFATTVFVPVLNVIYLRPRQAD
ncbi:hypothetical protein AB4Y64_13695 [Lysobacter sp. TAF61]|uniref:hypothetical protein n=1 Tax=Lysobacter sp. TAF61 TaxID=3233072 RepID=UPI003F969BAE